MEKSKYEIIFEKLSQFAKDKKVCFITATQIPHGPFKHEYLDIV